MKGISSEAAIGNRMLVVSQGKLAVSISNQLLVVSY
jgi:hypothetical protein